jgi:tetratricopeptide (TPR) repeat protein
VASDLDALVLRGMESTFRGDLESAESIRQAVETASPGHPLTDLLGVQTAFWRQMRDLDDPGLEASFRGAAATAIENCRSRLRRLPDDAYAHWCIGQTLMHLSRLDVRGGHYWSALGSAREGRAELERALELLPDLRDASFGLGVYSYYSSRLPAILRWLRWLWFVPDGDRDEGLRLLEQVRAEGRFNRLEAGLALFHIYAFLEHRPAEALALIDDFHRRFPDNTYFDLVRVELLFEMKRYAECLAAAAELERRLQGDPRDRPRWSKARLMRAQSELQLGQPERALATLEAIDANDPPPSDSIVAWTELVRARISDLRGDREEAKRIYERILSMTQKGSVVYVVGLAEEGLSEPFHLE